MDWSKAKTILIIALIITNSLLGYLVYSEYGREDPMFSEEFIGEVEDMLLDKNIRLNAEIPRYKPSLVPLVVEYEVLDIDNINESIFNGMGKVIEDGERNIIKYGKKEVEIFNDKSFNYRDRDASVVYDNLDDEKVKDIALNFIKQLKFQRDDMYLDYINKEKDKYRLVYSKRHEGVYLESSYMDIVIDSSGIKSFKRIWLDVEDKGDKEIYLTKAPKAILSLLSKEDAYGKSIEDISVCNYFDPLEHEYIESPEDASRGKTIPAWRVLFEDGTKIIIDDY